MEQLGDSTFILDNSNWKRFGLVGRTNTAGKSLVFGSTWSREKEQQVNNRSKQEVHIKSLRRRWERAWLAESSLMMHHETPLLSMSMHDHCRVSAGRMTQHRVKHHRVSVRENIRRLYPSKGSLRFNSQSTSEQANSKSEIEQNRRQRSVKKLCKDRRRVNLKVSRINCRMIKRVYGQFDR